MVKLSKLHFQFQIQTTVHSDHRQNRPDIFVTLSQNQKGRCTDFHTLQQANYNAQSKRTTTMWKCTTHRASQHVVHESPQAPPVHGLPVARPHQDLWGPDADRQTDISRWPLTEQQQANDWQNKQQRMWREHSVNEDRTQHRHPLDRNKKTLLTLMQKIRQMKKKQTRRNQTLPKMKMQLPFTFIKHVLFHFMSSSSRSLLLLSSISASVSVDLPHQYQSVILYVLQRRWRRVTKH